MENEQDLPFQSEEGCALDFFHQCSIWFWNLSSSTIVFLLLTLNKFYRFWNNTFVAFEIVQNEWEMNKI
jgi:hypothetical protein